MLKILNFNKVPLLTIITDEPVSGDLINEFLKIEGITRVSIY